MKPAAYTVDPWLFLLVLALLVLVVGLLIKEWRSRSHQSQKPHRPEDEAP